MTKQLLKQRGITFIGLIVVLAVVIFFAVIGIKLFPAYSEFSSVKSIINDMGKSAEFDSMSEEKIKGSFERGASIGYVSTVNSKDLVIENNADGKRVVSIEYQVVKPIVGNISILLDFKASTDKSNLDMLKK